VNGNDELLEQTPYFEKIINDDDYEYALRRVKQNKKKLSTPFLNEKEIYDRIGKAIKKTPIDPKKSILTGNLGGLPSTRSAPTKRENVIMQVIPVDESRSVEIRMDPTYSNKLTFAATKEDWDFPKDYFRTKETETPPPIPRKFKKDIASITLDPDSGYVTMVNSSYPGAKEGAIERLMMEAVKRDMTPHSVNLLEPGKKMVKKYADEYANMPKEKYLQKIASFLKTGKTGKIWSTVAPYVLPATAGAAALGYSDIAGAASDVVIPGGLEEAAIADERAIPDPRYQEYIKRMSQRKK